MVTPGGHLDVDSIGVGFVPRCTNPDIPYRDAVAAVEHTVAQLTVERGEATDQDVVAVTEC